jgi:hypothetical protein
MNFELNAQSSIILLYCRFNNFQWQLPQQINLNPKRQRILANI